MLLWQERNGVRVRYISFPKHLSLEALKQEKITQSNTYLGKNDIPLYPKENLEFHIGNIYHATDEKSLLGIMNSSGFKSGVTGCSYWSLHIEEGDIEEAENRYLQNVFPHQTDDTRPNQDRFLNQFTTSPAFLQPERPESRYGNYIFTFPIEQLLNSYQEQFCKGKQPVMRICETRIYKQEIVYVVLVHRPQATEFDSFPLLTNGDGDDVQAVCAYRSGDGKVVWRAQAMSETHHKEMIIDEKNKVISAKPCDGREEFYVWDHVSLAFHLGKGEVLEVKDADLRKSLTACHKSEKGPYLGLSDSTTFVSATKKIQQLRDETNKTG